MSHPEFFSSAKLNGYTPPNKEVLVHYMLSVQFNHFYILSFVYVAIKDLLPETGSLISLNYVCCSHKNLGLVALRSLQN